LVINTWGVTEGVEKRKKGEEKEIAARVARAPELEKAPPSSSRS
jgi:hypothetical protein